ncbi:hypothetical protein FOS14_20595 [Skermania sp. ID1734]|uniref:hypothetical protein n=1 Tax=Skermania sp. ID1734 TaxID=2597516 RepID=UPI00117D3A5E|nr:hypothetical protein [Skermania sp. ID1734]TSD94423.1 hypothetical protein FOS14_20595 [Skermania sp. ID1734]
MQPWSGDRFRRTDSPADLAHSWAEVRRVLGRLVVAGLFVGLLIAFLVGWGLAYKYLIGTFCDGQPMDSADRCTVFTVGTSRVIEKLNPQRGLPTGVALPFTSPSYLGDIRIDVYTPAQMRDLHRGKGYLGVGLVALSVFILGTWAYRDARSGRVGRSVRSRHDGGDKHDGGD